ncbi:MAG: ATP-grasp domain-containing protein [Treponema sp.]|nr:ATP-grasp domain-containing protein [Treponema sp.]
MSAVKENVLILGAGLMQKPAILSAKELGFNTVVIDADDKAVSIPYADEFRIIDLKDREEILAFAKELQQKGGLKAVFTAGTDFSASVSFVCEQLGLPAHSFNAALNASIKTQMRQCFKESKVPSPEFVKVGKDDISDTLLNSILQKMDFPLVVKPVDNMGARGCRMVRSEVEFLPAIKIAVECSRTGFAIVEEYMEGPEYSIDALVYNGTFTVTGFAERHIYYPPYFIEVGHTMPAILDKKIHDGLISVFALGAKSLGLTCGAAKADIKYTKNGPMIGEIAGRLSGGYMSGWTYPYASDLNLTKQGLLISCGMEPSELVSRREAVDYNPGKQCQNAEKPYELFEIPCKRTSAERAWMSIPGTVEYIENITEYTDKAVFDFLPRATVSIGSEVDYPRNNVQKCGNIISVSHLHDIAMGASEDAVSNIFITLKPNNPATEEYLAGKTAEDEEDFPPSAYGKLSEEELNAISGKIEKNKKIEENIPNILKSSEYIKKRDWNYNTIAQTAKKFDILRPNHPELDAKGFWKALMRGGLQGCVYYSDSVENRK